MRPLFRTLVFGCAAFLLSASPFIAQDGKDAPEKKPVPATPISRPQPAPVVLVDVAGKVSDADGKPVANLVVSEIFSIVDGQLKWSDVEGTFAKTGDDGSYSLKVDQRALSRGGYLWAMAADGSVGGFAALAKVEGDKIPDVANVAIKVSKLVKVTGTLKADGVEAGTLMASGRPVAELGTKQLAFPSSSSSGDSFTFFVPTGTYEFQLGSRQRELARLYHPLTVDASKPQVDLGTLTLKKAPLFGGIGQPAPELDVTLVRGTDNTKLADFKGKWILLEFWGVW